MAEPRDLRPAADAIASIVEGVPADSLTHPTPSTEYLVGDLLEHVDGLSAGLQAAARKQPVPESELRDGDADLLRPDWRERIPVQLADLARAWGPPSAWQGETVEGGVPLLASAAGMFVLDELVVHGWELARATGQPFDAPEDDVLALIDFLSSLPPMPEGEGLFAPRVPISETAPPMDRLLGLTGRDPSWLGAARER
ncbi:MAG: TIGR03086 family metal-binding protein [Brachybacterium tyrofermentans]|uniref:TIGR03086 family metal-binding protein n=1 Tax=Brachybacterium tyrofermentans TaxID=47848 RepID=UPI003FB90CBC